MLQRWLGRFGAVASEDKGAPPPARDWQRAAVPVGMVQLGSMTYRILRLAQNHYGVVRLIDDKFLGHFVQRPVLKVSPEPAEHAEHAEHAEVLIAIAKRAIRAGRTSWVHHVPA